MFLAFENTVNGHHLRRQVVGTKTKSERAGKNATSKIFPPASILSSSPLSAPGYPMMAITGDWYEFDTPLPAVLFYAPLVALDSLVALLSLAAGSHWKNTRTWKPLKIHKTNMKKTSWNRFIPLKKSNPKHMCLVWIATRNCMRNR